MSLQIDSGSERTNPFPATAVARLVKGSRELLTIETPALDKMKAELQDYLLQQIDTGKTICIVGEYGTGKTHLLMEALKIIYAVGDETLHPFYLDAPSDNFLSLYLERFLPKLNPLEVSERLNEAFAEIVAEELKNDEIYSSLVPTLLNGEIGAIDLIRQIGLMESRLLRQFKRRLKGITEDECFLMALYLFIMPEFHDSVWDWFNGNNPDDALRERGISKIINNDPIALEAIGVLAFLFGQQGHRFILLIDELEKVFSPMNSPTESTALAFKKLFEAISNTKALLILSGLQDFYETLPADAKQRVSTVIRPSFLTQADVIEYIMQANERAVGERVLSPFSVATAGYIATISGGNARKIVRLCYHAFQIAIAENINVSRRVIREVAQDQFGAQSAEQVSQEILQVIERHGWIFEINKTIEQSKYSAGKHVVSKGLADYWLPIGTKSTGIGIVHVQDVFSESDQEVVLKKYSQLSYNDRIGIKVASVLIISGFVADKFIQGFRDNFDRVIIYKSRDFQDELDAVLSGLRTRIEQRDKEDKIDLILSRLQQLDRQINSLHRLTESRVANKDDIRSLIQLIGTEKKQEFKLSPDVPNSVLGSQYFQSVFSIFDSIDRKLLKPFTSLSSFRTDKNTSLLFFAQDESFANFYFLHGLSEMFFFSQLLYQEEEYLPSQKPSQRIIRLEFGLLISSILKSQSLMSLSQLFSKSTNAPNSSIEIELENLSRRLIRLTHEIIDANNLSIDKLPTNRVRDFSIQDFTEHNNFFVSRFTELNSQFFIVQNGMNAIHKLIMHNSNLVVDTGSQNQLTQELSNFFYLYRMIFLFIEIMVTNLEDSLLDSRVQDLRRLCPLFDEILSSGSKAYRKSSRLGILNYLERNLLNPIPSHEAPRDLNELLNQVFELPKRTYDMLSEIRERYSPGKH